MSFLSPNCVNIQLTTIIHLKNFFKSSTINTHSTPWCRSALTLSAAFSHTPPDVLRSGKNSLKELVLSDLAKKVITPVSASYKPEPVFHDTVFAQIQLHLNRLM